MFGNSGDSIAVFLPLIAETERPSVVVILCTFIVMIALWGSLAYIISGQKELARRIEAKAQYLIPWVMIGVGLYILSNTTTDTLII